MLKAAQDHLKHDLYRVQDFSFGAARVKVTRKKRMSSDVDSDDESEDESSELSSASSDEEDESDTESDHDHRGKA